MSCTECKIGQIVEDEFEGEKTLVCLSCGCVPKNAACRTFVGARNPNFESTVLEQKYHARVDNHQPLRWLTRYKQTMDSCVDKFSNDNNQMIKQTAHDFIIKMVQDGNMLKRSKGVLAAACVYMALKQFDIPVSVHAITKEMGTTSSKINKVLDKMKILIGCNVARSSIKDEVRMAINNLALMNENEALTEKAMDIFTLLDRFTLVDGRSPRSIASVCAYLALVSKEKSKGSCMTVNKFCQKCRIPVHRLCDLFRVAKPRIILMAKRLPFTRSSLVNERNFHHYIDPILRFKDVLLNNFVEDPGSDEDVESTDLVNPPSLYNVMKLPEIAYTPEASTSEVICEDDIPDSEIGLYLRSQDEVMRVENIQGLMNSDSEEKEA